MKLNFPKIVRDVSLSEYAPEINSTIQVWVNPSGRLLAALADTFRAYVDSKGQEGQDAFLAVLSELLSQGADKWSVDELRELYEGTTDTDPAFWMWLQNRILKEISEHRHGVKKA